MLKIHYFASVREQLARGSESLTLPAGVATVADLVEHLVAQDAKNAVLADSRQVLVAVNQSISGRDHPLEGDEEVAFFPPVTGG